MNTTKKEGGRRKKTLSFQQKLENARRAKAKSSLSARLAPVTVSPAEIMTGPYAALGWVFRSFLAFLGVCALLFFLCDAAELVVLSDARVKHIVLDAVWIVLWSAVTAGYYSLMGLTRTTYALSPFLALGGGALYLFLTNDAPVSFLLECARCLKDRVLSNMAEVGYTTYLQYVGDGVYAYPEETLLRFSVAFLTVFFGSLLCLSVVRRVYPLPVTLLTVLFLVPVFMFNVTRSNQGLAMILVFLCGALALYLYDRWFLGLLVAKKAKKEARRQAKAAKKDARRAKAEEKRSLKRQALAAYTAAVEAGLDAKTAVRAKNAVLERAAEEKTRAKAQAKEAALEKTRRRKAAKSQAKAAAREARQMRQTDRELDSRRENRAARTEVRAKKRREKRAIALQNLKIIAAGGYVGTMAMLVAFLAVWLPLAAVKHNFPIIDAINNRMQLARTYVTAYLMGDDVDLNSLALYGGVSELNPRNVNFDTPQYTGQILFHAEAGYPQPVYLRSWIGLDYDVETDSWRSADTDEVIAYRSRFGSKYSSDNITYFFNAYVYPNSVDIPRYDQYRNLDDYGFRVFQINVERRSGSSKLLFVPSIMNASLGLMQYGSLEPVTQKYSAFYDGIYSSRFFMEDSSYSTSSFVPVMKDPAVGANFEGAILYYNLANRYCDAIDQISAAINSNLLFDEGREYTYETDIGTLTFAGSDLSFLNDLFLADLSSRTDYQYRVDSLVSMYLAMTTGERRIFQNSFNTELNYRDYANETYTASFGLPDVSALAREILSDAGIVMREKPVYDKSFMEGMNESQIGRLSAMEKYGNVYETWFTDAAGNPVPRHQAVMAVINYLRYNYEYTLTPKTAMKEALDEDGQAVLDEEGNPILVPDLSSETNIEAFLFEVKQGYCVHFATAAIALLRELGFAVRYDEGYIASGWNRTYNPAAVSTYAATVRDYDAHSWIEVYYPSMGWVPYETTPAYGAEMYDIEETGGSESSGSLDPSRVTVSTPQTEEEVPVVDEEDDEFAYWSLVIAGGAAAFLLLSFVVAALILRARATRSVGKRKKLIEEARDEDACLRGETDVSRTARKLIDAIFDVFDGMGVPHETGELPQEYADRLSADYASLSKHPLPEVMRIIEKEEFGGRLSFRELERLADYLEDITSAVYAGLPFADRVRMRYFKNII